MNQQTLFPRPARRRWIGAARRLLLEAAVELDEAQTVPHRRASMRIAKGLIEAARDYLLALQQVPAATGTRRDTSATLQAVHGWLEIWFDSPPNRGDLVRLAEELHRSPRSS